MNAHLLIGATASECGKTTFTLGLLRALKRRTYRVQPFKCGPDYIDTHHHTMAAGCPSINLDSFIMTDTHLNDLYTYHTADADVAVTEGVMGLFDGFDGMAGSSAEIAIKLDIPIVLLINAKSMAYSVAPMIYGFKHFNPKVKVKGVVFNFVASEEHYSYLKQACLDVGVEALGYLPRQADIALPSRHLGLSLDGDCCFDTFADRIALLVERHVDLDRLLTLCAYTPSSVDSEQTYHTPPNRFGVESSGLRIAIARDAAFNFTYEENIRLLHAMGTVSYFSPLADTVLPEADFIYLPGGYPELYLKQLSNNKTLLTAIRTYAEAGGKLLAECGGMMYLCRDISDTDGIAWPMVGVLPQSATMKGMKLKLGYRTLKYNDFMLKGHEFHYSCLLPQEVLQPSVAEAYDATGRRVDTPLYRYKNVLAGYTHLYWADKATNHWFATFIK
ncbi:MAG: cobyrinate a,c-diamide synthase [Tannerellaceae bacterium]